MDALPLLGKHAAWLISVVFAFFAGALSHALDFVWEEVKENRKREREAARSLYDAALDLQHAAWSFYAMHSRYGVAESTRDRTIEQNEKLKTIGDAFKVFAQDVDLPDALAEECAKRRAAISLDLVNMLAFSVTGQGSEIERCAREIERECTELRDIARQYIWGLVRRAWSALRKPVTRPISRGPRNRHPA